MLIEKKMTEENKSKKRPVRFPDTMYKPTPARAATEAFKEEHCLHCGRDYFDWEEEGCQKLGCANYTG